MTRQQARLRVVGLGGTLRDDSTSLHALERALAAAREAGAETELLDLRELDLPIYEPGRPLEEYGAGVGRLVEAMRGADAMIWSTAAYHGTLAGATKNALDFAQFLSGDERPYLQDRVIGLVATAGGGMAGPHTVDAMVHIVHALRGIAAPLSVPIASAWKVFADDGEVGDEAVARRLDTLGAQVVQTAARLGGASDEAQEGALSGAAR